MNSGTIRGTSLIAYALMLLLFVTMTASVARAANNDGDAPIVGTAKLSESEALVIAEKAYTGSGKFTDIELEMQDGVLVYAVEYTETDGNEVDVKLDAKTGAVVVVESDKNEAVNDDEGDTEEDDTDQTAKMQTLINLLNQLISLLKLQMHQ